MMTSTRRLQTMLCVLVWGLSVVAAPAQPSADQTLRPTIGVAHGLNGGASVNFVAPANPSAAITGYRATAMPVDAVTGLPVTGGATVTAEGPGSPMVISGLANGTPYRFTVAALTAGGAGPVSLASNVMTPAASNVPPLDQRVMWVLPSNGKLLGDASAFDTAATELATRMGNNATLQRSKVGMSVFVELTMPDWTVDVSNPAAVRAALSSAMAPIDAAIANANTRTPKMPVGISLITAIRERVDGVQTAAEAEDRRNVQWYQDQAKASGWVTYSQYALKLRRVQEAYVREFGRMLAERMIAHPEVLVVVTGDGETEMTYDRFRSVEVPLAQRAWADYSPFAVAEFRDWLRKAGPYADTGRLAGQAWEFAARYAGDASPATDTNGDGHTLNGDFNLSFTTWDLRFFNYDTTSETDGLIPGSQSVTLTGGTTGGFDAPRTLNVGHPWFDTWNRFRQEMIWRYNRDFSRWITVSTSAALGGIPADRWYSAQIPTDMLFGFPPPDQGARILTSGSAHWTAQVWPFGSMGVTSYNANPTSQGQGSGAIDPTKYFRTTPNVAPRASALSPRWGIAEWNPSDPWSRNDATGQQVYRDDIAVLLRHRPSMVMPYRMTDGAGNEEPLYRVYSSGFEPVLKEFVATVGAAGGWEPTLEWAPPAALPAGTVLTTAHLNATANVPGTFTYSPAMGSAMPASGSLSVTATFTPADDSYAARTLTRTINVSSAPRMTLSATQLTFRGFSTSTVLSQLSAPQSVEVSFSGAGTAIPWTVTAPAGLAFHTPSTGTGNGTITVSLSTLNGFVNSGLFPAEGLEYTLTVSAPTAAPGTQTQTIRVVIALTAGETSTFSATPGVLTIPAGGGSRDIAIRSTAATAPWRVSSSASWLSFHRVEGRGDGFVAVTASANTGAARTATILAAGQTLTVTQEGTGGGGGGGTTLPGAPSGFTASATGLQLSGMWTAPTTGGAPTSYQVDVCTTADFAVLLTVIPVTTGTSFSLPAPAEVAGQTFYLRVRGVNAAGTGAPSVGQSVTFAGGGGGGTTLPGAPSGFTASATGLQLSGSWAVPTTGGAPTSYLVEVSTTADFAAVLTTIPVTTGTSFTVTAPAEAAGQTFHLRVRGVNAAGNGTPSAGQSVTFAGGGGGGTTLPGAPSGFTASATGLQLSGSWAVPTTGGAPTSYLVEVSTTANFAAVLTTIPVTTGTSFTVTAPAEAAGQTFHLRVRGVNAAGNGTPSAGQSVTFAGGGGGGTTLPGAPSGFTASATGLTVLGSWTAPTTGGAVSSYLVEVSTTADFAAVLTTIPVTTGTSFNVTAPPEAAGQTFYLRVRGVNAAGNGTPSAGQSVTFAPAF
jgi:hypothetical protein